MIEPDLDLEADLSIDSIKRTEIAGEIASRFAQHGLSINPTDLDQLATARTTEHITTWLQQHLNTTTTPTAPTPAVTTDASSEAVPGHVPERLLFQKTRLESPRPASNQLAGRTLLIIGSVDIAQAAAETAIGFGAQARVIAAEQAEAELRTAQADGVLYLDPLENPATAEVPDAFPIFKAALAQAPRYLLAARPLRAQSDLAEVAERTIGLRGLFRSLAREYPQTLVRLIDLEPTRPADTVAQAIIAELADSSYEPIVDVVNGERSGLELAVSDLGLLGATGAGPGGAGSAEAEALQLDQDAVVVLVGGGRGITAQFAATLAASSRCRLELLGRTELDDADNDAENDGELSGLADRTSLRRALASRPGAVPADIEQEINRILAQREVRTTVDGLRALGSDVGYRAVDVRDTTALRAALMSTYEKYGRIDGIIYAAGVIEDKLVTEKDPESFRRVYSTKVHGAATILDVAEQLPVSPGFVVFFGSISAALGNRGQSDYAAANDALEAMGTAWSQRTGRRAMTVHWGPWAPAEQNPGMVSPELGRDYARRGIKLIDPEAGTFALLKELAWGQRDLNAVVYTASAQW
ncbi:SDR family oxidoreductase [Acaricomes phytoseiuli]|uniref:SDR family NAD(P)-dependent oxidoreductase n=1 Tax=Acaricomes phytoseiuli TaxID=291968 RepID=UPI002223619C|nr:SDR family oxidoreductase [Acaricomes phytoseiuli]MCW1249515.1 SDR family oxidoreductase [Acaricomes phytoseiuli]